MLAILLKDIMMEVIFNKNHTWQQKVQTLTFNSKSHFSSSQLLFIFVVKHEVLHKLLHREEVTFSSRLCTTYILMLSKKKKKKIKGKFEENVLSDSKKVSLMPPKCSLNNHRGLLITMPPVFSQLCLTFLHLTEA